MDLGKELRHRALRDLVARRAIRTQRELVSALKSQGIPATQATVSRDITELGLTKVDRSGSPAYALSYKSQRDINARTPESLPDILVYGHYHTSFYMLYRNVHFIQSPCFKDSGYFEKRLGMAPNIGGWIIDMHIGANGIDQLQPTLFNY